MLNFFLDIDSGQGLTFEKQRINETASNSFHHGRVTESMVCASDIGKSLAADVAYIMSDCTEVECSSLFNTANLEI